MDWALLAKMERDREGPVWGAGLSGFGTAKVGGACQAPEWRYTGQVGLLIWGSGEEEMGDTAVQIHH